MMAVQHFIHEDLCAGLPCEQFGLKPVDSLQLDSLLLEGQSVVLVYPLPWQISTTLSDHASLQSWSNCISGLLQMQECHPDQFSLLPLDVYLPQNWQPGEMPVLLQRHLYLGAMYFANRHPEVFDLLTAIESNAQLMGRDPFVQYDYPKLPVACLEELILVFAQESVKQPVFMAENNDEKIEMLTEQNSKLMDQMRYLQESLERNHHENQALRYEADKSAKVMQKAYKMIMSKSTSDSNKGVLN